MDGEKRIKLTEREEEKFCAAPQDNTELKRRDVQLLGVSNVGWSCCYVPSCRDTPGDLSRAAPPAMQRALLGLDGEGRAAVGFADLLPDGETTRR